jgi:hypothetical protein
MDAAAKLTLVHGVVVPSDVALPLDARVLGMAWNMEQMRQNYGAHQITAEVRFSGLRMSEWVGIVDGWAVRVCAN